MVRGKDRIIPKRTVLSKSVWEMAEERTARAFDLYDTVVVSFSGGKDSTVVLNLAIAEAKRRNRLPLKVMFFDEEAIPMETEQYVRRVSKLPEVDLDWMCLPIVHRNGCSTDDSVWYPWAPESEDLWVRPMPPEAKTYKDFEHWPVFPIDKRIGIPDSNPVLYPARQYGSVGFLLGIRADESVRRRQAVTAKIKDNYIIPMKQGQFKVYPIYDFSTPDVWRAPRIFNWDYNQAYDLMELAGISHHMQRIAPPYGEQPMQALWMFKKCFPEVWDKMGERVPGAKTAARYSRGTLYGAGQGAIKETDLREGETWEQRIISVLQKYTEEERQWVTHHMMGFIRRHYHKTADPIMTRPHPVTGVSWKLLYKIAEKGDFKHRATPRLTTEKSAIRPAIIRQYQAEISRKGNNAPEPTTD